MVMEKTEQRAHRRDNHNGLATRPKKLRLFNQIDFISAKFFLFLPAPFIFIQAFLSLIDIDEKTIPDEVTVPGTILGLGFAIAYPWSLLPAEVAALWRLSVPPASGAKIAAELAEGEAWLMDWGGGRLWIARRNVTAEDAALVRKAVAAVGGHATLVRGPESLRQAIDVFPMEAPPALLQRTKAAFDPHGILNPGRMYRGW